MLRKFFLVYSVSINFSVIFLSDFSHATTKDANKILNVQNLFRSVALSDSLSLSLFISLLLCLSLYLLQNSTYSLRQSAETLLDMLVIQLIHEK